VLPTVTMVSAASALNQGTKSHGCEAPCPPSAVVMVFRQHGVPGGRHMAGPMAMRR
jgi:hypothetical protein